MKLYMSVNSKIAVGSNMKFFRYKEMLGIATSINAPYNVQTSLSKYGLNLKKCINVDNILNLNYVKIHLPQIL